MRDLLLAGDWECFKGSRQQDEQTIPIIICRPKADPAAPYFTFLKDKVILEKSDSISIVPDNINKRIIFKEAS